VTLEVLVLVIVQLPDKLVEGVITPLQPDKNIANIKIKTIEIYFFFISLSPLNFY
jgi:hypothetical protein